MEKSKSPLSLTLLIAILLSPITAFCDVLMWSEVDGYTTISSSGRVNAINNSSQVVGRYYQSKNSTAFLWTKEDGMLFPIATDGVGSFATSINDNGVMVGTIYELGTTDYRGFLWDEISGMTNIGLQPNSINGDNFVNDINSQNQVVGDSYGSGGYIWTEDNGYTALIESSWHEGTTADAINDNGQVVGSTLVFGDRHVYTWTEAGGMVDLGISHIASGRSTDINNNGWVVTNTPVDGADHAFVWAPELGLLDLGTLGGSESQAFGINDFGQVVGSSTDANGVSTGFLWTETDGMVALPLFDSAVDINNLGQVVGYGNGHSVTTTQSYTTDYLTLGETFAFDWWEMGMEPTEFNLDVLFFNGIEWETFGWALNFNGASDQWNTASFWVPPCLSVGDTAQAVHRSGMIDQNVDIPVKDDLPEVSCPPTPDHL